MGRRLGRRANVAIEFAVIGPVMILAMIMVLEFGVQLMVGSMLDYGVRMSARWSVTGAAPPAGQSRVQYIQGLIISASGGFLQSSRLTLELQSYASWAAAAGRTAPVAGAGGSATVVTYTARYSQPFMTGLVPAILGRGAIVHSAATLVNNEPYPTP